MRKSKSRILKIAVAISLLIFCIAAAVILSQPILLKALRAKFKSTEDFIVLSTDSRIRYQEHSQKNAIAEQIILQYSQDKVELILKSEFKKEIEV